MIDKKFQNKGIGRKTMEIVLDKITSVSTAKRIEIAYEPENVIVKDLYLSFGFEDTNIKNSDDEFIMFKELKKMEE